MKYLSHLPIPLILSLVIISGSTQAQDYFLEDFTTTEFRFQSSDSPDWDTEAGELRMWPFASSLEGLTDTPGSAARNISLYGNFAFVANGYNGVSVIDISEPGSPVTVGNLDTPGYLYEVQVAGQYGYLADHSGGFRVISVLDPASPTEVTSLGLGDLALGLCVEGHYAYVAIGGSGLAIVDISNPLSPQLVGTSAASTARSVDVAGSVAYVGNGDDGLVIMDISDPSTPFTMANYAISGYVRDVEVRGNYAYVVADDYGLEIVDISNPAAPVPAGTLPGSGSMFGITVQGQRAYLCNDTTGLLKVDISSPQAPILMETIETTGHANAVVVTGEMALVADFGPGVQAIRVAQFNPPYQRSSAGNGVTRGMPGISGDLMYLPAGASGMNVVDISDRSVQVQVGNYNTEGYVRGVRISGDRAYLAKSDAGMEIVDISNPANPTSLGTFDTGDNVLVMEIAGNFAFMAGSDQMLYSMDISDPGNPFQLGQIFNDTAGWGVVVIGEYAYVAQPNGITKIDLKYLQNWGTEHSGSFWHLIPLGDGFVTSGSGGNSSVIYQILQDEVDQERAWGRSSYFHAADDEMIRFRYSTNHVGNFTMEIVVALGFVISDGEENLWYESTNPRTDMSWDAKLHFVPGVTTTISELKIEWLYHHPLIEVIDDIPNDQGRQVSLEWVRSGHDFIGDEEQILEYAVYRQIDGDLLGKAALQNGGKIPEDAAAGSHSLQESATAMLAEGWHFLTTVPAMTEDRYAVVVPTLADSTAGQGDYNSIFKVVALTGTPGMNFSSYPDSGSSVDNLAPGVPSSVTALYGEDNVELSWDESPAEDFQYFRIYRGTEAAFVPDAGNLIHQVVAPSWIDESDAPSQYYYKITAMDFSGNESPAGEVINVSDALVPGLTFSLQGASPNPFNPSTNIRYSLPQTGRVQLLVYDVAGRLIRTLVDDVMPEGEHQVRWDGRNQAGQVVASGAYFSLLRSGQQVERQRMMLMK